MKNNDVIITLKGPDRIRLRPAVVFGDDGREGVTKAVSMLLDIFILEAAMGFSKEISVKLNEDASVTLISCDRGLVLDETLQGEKPFWFNVFCDFYPGPREADDAYYYEIDHKHNTFYGAENDDLPEFRTYSDPGFSLCAVQYCSEWMEVETVHGNLCKSIRFEKGFPASDITTKEVSLSPYTKITFKPDREVFSDISVSFEAVADLLRAAAIGIPLLTCFVSKGEKSVEFCYPLGGGDCVKSFAGAEDFQPIYRSESYNLGQDRRGQEPYSAEVRVFIGFVPERGQSICVHNFRSLPDGGKHLNAAWDKISAAFGETFGGNVKREDLEKRIVLLLDTKCTVRRTSWANVKQTAIDNPMISKMVENALGDFPAFLEGNKEHLLPLMDMQ